MEENTKKPSENNRRRSRTDRRKKPTSDITATAQTTASDNPNEDNGCLSKKICRGKHKKYDPSETSLKNAEVLFKSQTIQIINTEEECRAILSELRRHLDEYNVLGFDCEWLSQYKRYPVALLQLATHRGLCVLIRLCKLKKIPEEVKQLLEDKNVLKVGIQPFVDAKYLVQDYKISCVASTLDLRSLSKECGYKSKGLGGLAEEVLQVELNKNRCVAASNWEVDTLPDIQIEYAAKDALVSLELFRFFEEKLKPKPSDCNKKQHVQEFIDSVCVKYLNLKKKPSNKPKIDCFKNQEIRYVNTVDECKSAINILKSHCEKYNVLGYKFLKAFHDAKPVYMVELASHRRLSVIFKLNDNLDNLPAELKELLEDKRILKVGIRPANRISTECHVNGILDLSYLVCKYTNRRELPLHKLSRWFLGVKLNKRPSLKAVEKHLRTNDAHISIEIFKELLNKFGSKVEDKNQKIDLQAFIEEHCLPHLDTLFNRKSVIVKGSENGETVENNKK